MSGVSIQQIQLRRDTLANWMSQNPILQESEQGYIIDVYPIRYVVGDGLKHFNELKQYSCVEIGNFSALSGYRVVTLSQLPTTESTLGYLVSNDSYNLYIWVGSGGNAVGGTYQNCGPLRGPAGATGPTGPQGPAGASGVTGAAAALLVDNLTTNDGTKILSARQGYILNNEKAGYTVVKSNVAEIV